LAKTPSVKSQKKISHTHHPYCFKKLGQGNFFLDAGNRAFMYPNLVKVSGEGSQ